MNNLPVPSFHGVIPQLVAGVILLEQRRSDSGFWGDDAWVTAKILEALVAYNNKVEKSEGLERSIRDSARALSDWLTKEADEIANAMDLYAGLDQGLRAVCATDIVLHLFDEKLERDTLARVEPAVLKLLDSGSDYAKAIENLALAGDVLRCVQTLDLSVEEAASLIEPWLVVATRVLLNPGNGTDRIRALNVLLRTRGTSLEPLAGKIWAKETPRMTAKPKVPESSFEDAIAEYGKVVLDSFRPSNLEEMCLLIESQRMVKDEVSLSQLNLLPEFLRLLTDGVATFGHLGTEAQVQAIAPIASAVRVLSESSMAQVLTFSVKDEERITKCVSIAEKVESGRTRVIPKAKYTGLQAVALVLVYLWAVTFGWFNPGLAWLAGIAAAAITGVVVLVFRPEA